jgi:hypothetical protein
MNERIKELSEQALEIVSKKRLLKDGQLERTWNPDDYDQVFAELIVRECVRYFNEDYQRDFDSLWREDLTNAITEHFGVEE